MGFNLPNITASVLGTPEDVPAEVAAETASANPAPSTTSTPKLMDDMKLTYEEIGDYLKRSGIDLGFVDKLLPLFGDSALIDMSGGLQITEGMTEEEKKAVAEKLAQAREDAAGISSVIQEVLISVGMDQAAIVFDSLMENVAGIGDGKILDPAAISTPAQQKTEETGKTV
jgi:hypothetical protein